MTNIDETELARLERLADNYFKCVSLPFEESAYRELAAHFCPALVAEVRRLREALNKEHRAWQCAEGRGDGLEMENTALREKVEAWEWFEEVRIYKPWNEHPNWEACGNSSKRGKIFDRAVDEYKLIYKAAREAVHADRE